MVFAYGGRQFPVGTIRDQWGQNHNFFLFYFYSKFVEYNFGFNNKLDRSVHSSAAVKLFGDGF